MTHYILLGQLTNQTPFNCHYYRLDTCPILLFIVHLLLFGVCYRVRITVPSIQVLKLKSFHPVPELESAVKADLTRMQNHHKNSTTTHNPHKPTHDLHPNLSKNPIHLSPAFKRANNQTISTELAPSFSSSHLIPRYINTHRRLPRPS